HPRSSPFPSLSMRLQWSLRVGLTLMFLVTPIGDLSYPSSLPSEDSSSTSSSPPPSLPASLDLGLGRSLDLRVGWGSLIWRGGEGVYHWEVQESSEVRLWRIEGYPDQWRWNQRFNWKLSREVNSSLIALVGGDWEQFQLLQKSPFRGEAEELPLIPITLGYSQPYLNGSIAPFNRNDYQTVEGGIIFDMTPWGRWDMSLGYQGIQKGNFKRDGGRWVGGWENIHTHSRFKLLYERSYAFPSGERSLRGEGEYRWEKNPYAQNEMQLTYWDVARQIFLPRGEELGRRKDQRVIIENRLRYQPFLRNDFSWQVRFDRRRSHTAYPGRISGDDQESNWDNQLSWQVQTGGWRWDLIGGWRWRDQEYNRHLTQTRTGTISVHSLYQGEKVEVVRGLFTLQRYWLDTPDPQEKNDRDELRLLSEGEAILPISPSLKVKIGGSDEVVHMVYLFRPRSAENRREEVISLRGGMEFVHPPLSTRLGAVITAQTTAYDYFPWRATSSRIYRHLTLSDSLTLRIRDTWSAIGDASFTWSALGQLDPDQWITQTGEKGRIVKVGVMVERSTSYLVNGSFPMSGTTWGVGIALHRRVTFDPHDGKRVPLERVLSYGPRLKGEWRGKRSSLRLESQWWRIEELSRGLWNLPDVTLSYHYEW
ncbi:MAG: hypothetical protein ACK4OO_05315, partial [bacterium]